MTERDMHYRLTLRFIHERATELAACSEPEQMMELLNQLVGLRQSLKGDMRRAQLSHDPTARP